MSKIAIVGSRSITDYLVFNEAFNKNVSFDLFLMIDTVVSGGAVGVDTLAEQFAYNYDLSLIVFRPDYNLYGKRAPLERNKQIVDECDGLFAFWDGKSSGTMHAVKYAQSQNKPVKIIRV